MPNFVSIALAVILVIAVAVFISVAVAILISAAVVAGKTWKFPGELLKPASGLHSLPLEMPGRLPEALGEPLARLGRSGDRPGCVSGALGVVLGAYKRCLGHSLGDDSS